MPGIAVRGRARRGFGLLVGLVLAGLLAGFAGVALIMGTRLTGGADPLGVALCVLGALSLAIATLTLRRASGAQTGIAALLAVVGFAELTFATRQAAGTTKAFFTFFLAAGVIYLVITLLSAWAFHRIEAWARRGEPRNAG